MQTTVTRTVGVALGVIVIAVLAGATNGINTNQVRTAAPGTVSVSGVAAAEGSSLAVARADHTHSLTGTLPSGNGGTGVSTFLVDTVPLAAAANTWTPTAFPSCSGGTNALTYNTTTHAFGCNTISGSYTLPALTATVLGGVKGTGTALACVLPNVATGFDAAGALQCAQPSAVTGNAATATNLANNVGTTTTVLHGNAAGAPSFASIAVADHSATGTPSATTFYRGDNTWNVPAGTYTLPDATAAVTGGVRLTGQLGGTATSPTVTGVTGAVITVANHSATGTPSATTYYRGDNTWSTPAGGGGADALGGYLVKTATNAPVNAQIMASLGTGLVLNTTTTGVQSIKGTNTCTNQFARSDTASGVWTCAGIGVADFTATGTPSATTFYRGDNTWSVPAGTYTLPDATAAVTGGVRLTGQLGGTATSPTVTGVTGAVISLTTNVTGTLPAGSGGTGAATFAIDSIPLATAANTWTPTAFPSCSGATNALSYNTTTHAIGCNTITGGSPTFSGLAAGAVMWADSTTTINDTAVGSAGQLLLSGGATTPTWLGLGTTTTLLHGNAAGAPTWAGVSLTADATTNQGTIWQTLHGNAAGAPTWGASPAVTMLTATWASSATANTTGIVGTGATPLTSPTYAAASPFGFRCMISTTRPATTNGPRYGVMATTGSITRISFHGHVGLAATTEVRTQLVAAMTANCAANCTTALTTGTLAQVMDDQIEGTGVMNASGTLSLYMAPSAAAANTAQIGSHCVWW
jgi:hypothetical protein